MRKAEIILVCAFIFMLLFPFVFAVFYPQITESNENRKLAGFPTISNTGIINWTSEFEIFLNDHLPFKGMATKIYSDIMLGLFHESTNDHVIIGKEGWLLYNGYDNDNPIDDLCGNNSFSEDDNAIILKKIEAFCDKHDISFVLFVAPNKETIYRNYFPDTYLASFVPNTRAQILSDYLKTKTDKFVFPYDDLMDEKERHQLYYKYDTHWNTIGAYIGLKAICDSLHINIPALNECSYTKNDKPVRKDLAYLLNAWDKYTDDHEYDLNPYPNITVNIGETNPLFENSFAYIQEYNSNAPNEQTIVLVGDSFSEVMVELFAKVFKKVIFIRRDTGKADEIYELIERVILPENKQCIVIMEVVERGIWWLTQHEYVF